MQSTKAILSAAVLSLATAVPLCVQAASLIDVPKGNELELSLRASGYQDYRCDANAGPSYVWTFVGPEATLFDEENEIVAKHYAGPTWESLTDGSKVVGTKIAAIPSATAGAIPQLLLSGTVVTPGEMFGKVTYIQRVNTTGGSAPGYGCDASTVGAVLKVPYKATYRFYEKD
jgi:hypothetical protein